MKNTKNAYEINHIEKTITLTKKFLKAASILDTKEYNELMKLIEKHPTFKLVEKKIEKKENKQTYEKLTIKKMKEFLSWLNRDDKEEKKKALEEFDEMISYYETFHKSGYYGTVKKWFLDNHGDAYRKYECLNKNNDDSNNSNEEPTTNEEDTAA